MIEKKTTRDIVKENNIEFISNSGNTFLLELKARLNVIQQISNPDIVWLSRDSLIDFITQLASYPHYNPDDGVQQFMLDIKKEIEK